MRELSRITEDEPASLSRFLHVALKSCSADTAGITLLQQATSGKPSLQWHTIAGELSAQEGFSPPRHFSPCGTCLDRAQPILLRHPHATFSYLADMEPTMSELLTVPLHDGQEQLGTLWMAHHNTERGFCADQGRIAERLALHLAYALKLSMRDREHRRALAYRDAQLRDAHHRVKNTLQIATSSLQLDAHATTSVSARKALQIGIGRLQILAKVHELIGRETGSEQVAVHTLLHSLVEAARQSFVEISARVDLKLKAAAMWLPADQAIPIALLANEAVTNACKHAFPGARSGEICIELDIDSGGTLVLRIADNGIGMTKQRTNGLGLQLIAGFSKQLRGNISFIEPVGTTGTTVMLTLCCKANRGAEEQCLATSDAQ